jgi:hypothetical protein
MVFATCWLILLLPFLAIVIERKPSSGWRDLAEAENAGAFYAVRSIEDVQQLDCKKEPASASGVGPYSPAT